MAEGNRIAEPQRPRPRDGGTGPQVTGGFGGSLPRASMAQAPSNTSQGVALTFGACTWWPRNKMAATCVTVSVPAW